MEQREYLDLINKINDKDKRLALLVERITYGNERDEDVSLLEAELSRFTTEELAEVVHRMRKPPASASSANLLQFQFGRSR